MNINHKLCKDSYRAHTMKRLYQRVNGKVVPCAWMCLDCGQMQKD